MSTAALRCEPSVEPDMEEGLDEDLGLETIDACIAACNECSRICLGHVRHCLGIGGEHADPDHIAMLLTCSKICRTAAELMTIESEWHPTFCDLCAQVCEECADACDAMDDMEECAAACRQCAQGCRTMVSEIGESADVTA